MHIKAHIKQLYLRIISTLLIILPIQASNNNLLTLYAQSLAAHNSTITYHKASTTFKASSCITPSLLAQRSLFQRSLYKTAPKIMVPFIVTGLCLWQATKYNIAHAAQQFIQWAKPKWALENDLPNGIPQEIDDVVAFLNDPRKFTKLGAELPKGILLYGPPGTGKTSIARAIAKTTNHAFFHTAGSELTAHLHGLGPDRVRALFTEAKAQGKAIIFIDEIEIIAQKRGFGQINSEQLSQLLHELDGFNKDTSLLVIAATNCKELVDQALLRPGRLGTHILIPLPDTQGRIDIINHYIKKITYKGKDISAKLAQDTEGYSGADLKYLINDATILAARENSRAVNESHLLAVLKRRAPTHA